MFCGLLKVFAARPILTEISVSVPLLAEMSVES